MNSELERMWKEAVVAQFETILWRLPGETEENHDRIVSLDFEIRATYLPNRSHVLKA
jgi:hypothetical protein